MKKILSTILCVLLPALFMLSANCAWAAKPKVMLGIDVLESQNFAPIAGKRVGLLTHPAGVNRYGISTVDILRRARNVKLVALFGPEHGIYGDEKADVPVLDKIDRRTGLPVYSLYGKYRKPTPEMLKKIDVLVIDLQDVGARSYTYISCMLRAMEACFENGKTVVVLDRPNPLGGLKADGPMLDIQFKSYVGMFQVPYVHGLTIGELAKFAKGTKGAMEITSKQQRNSKLVVVPMRGWHRSMRWDDTGLRWVKTSPAVPTAAAAIGYPMTGLGCQLGSFQHGYGTQYPFRFITYKGKTAEQVETALRQCQIRGLSYKRAVAKNAKGAKIEGVYVLVTDWNSLNLTELNFHMMRLACAWGDWSAFTRATNSQESLFNKHTGSAEWWREITTKGRNANVTKFVAKWKRQADAFRESSKKFHLYR